MLESLPHVGSIVHGGDHERVTRLLRTIRVTIDERAGRYSGVSASTITDHRRLAGRPDEPRIIVLIDNMSAFRQVYEVGSRFQWLDQLAGLAADGRPVGVHFVIASDQRTGLPPNSPPPCTPGRSTRSQRPPARRCRRRTAHREPG